MFCLYSRSISVTLFNALCSTLVYEFQKGVYIKKACSIQFLDVIVPGNFSEFLKAPGWN